MNSPGDWIRDHLGSLGLMGTVVSCIGLITVVGGALVGGRGLHDRVLIIGVPFQV